MKPMLRKFFDPDANDSGRDPDRDIEERLADYAENSPEFSAGFSERVMDKLSSESFAQLRAESSSAEGTVDPFEAALSFAFRRISLGAVAVALALLAFDYSKHDNSAIFGGAGVDNTSASNAEDTAPELEEILADPLFAQFSEAGD